MLPCFAQQGFVKNQRSFAALGKAVDAGQALNHPFVVLKIALVPIVAQNFTGRENVMLGQLYKMIAVWKQRYSIGPLVNGLGIGLGTGINYPKLALAILQHRQCNGHMVIPVVFEAAHITWIQKRSSKHPAFGVGNVPGRQQQAHGFGSRFAKIMGMVPVKYVLRLKKAI